MSSEGESTRGSDSHQGSDARLVGVISGSLATIGAAALLAPGVASYLGQPTIDLDSIGAAVPELLALAGASLLGGYVGGRMVGHHTSWYGLLTAMLTVLAALSYTLLQVAGQRNVLGLSSYAFPEILPPVLTFGEYHSPTALAFGVLLTLPAQILPAWLGGLLAPSHVVGAGQPRSERPITTDAGRHPHHAT